MRPVATPSTPIPTTSAATTAPPPVDPASVHANELGYVPVLMFHQLVAHPASRYDQTPAQFEQELDTIAADGYMPITAADYVNGHIDLPPGKHPVVLTFDDSTTSQLQLEPNGQPVPTSAVGRLIAFAKAHPGFRATATFFVNGHPFGNQPGTLRWLVAHGFDIGDHTLTHANLRTLTAAGVQQELAEGLDVVTGAVAGFQVTTMALPYGALPHDPALALHGAWGGTRYNFLGVFLVGANPAHSPCATSFDPGGIPRIRAQTLPGADAPYESTHWLAWLRAHPTLLYTSDGDPNRISFPRADAKLLAPKWRVSAYPY